MALTKEKLKELIAAGDLDLRMKTFTNSTQFIASGKLVDIVQAMPNDSTLCQSLDSSNLIYTTSENNIPTQYGFLIINKKNNDRFGVELRKAGGGTGTGSDYYMATVNTSTGAVAWFQYSGTAL